MVRQERLSLKMGRKCKYKLVKQRENVFKVDIVCDDLLRQSLAYRRIGRKANNANRVRIQGKEFTLRGSLNAETARLYAELNV